MADTNNTENWRPIKGREGAYEVSDHGRVRSLDYRRTGRTEILKPGTHRKGYLTVVLCMDGQRKTCKVHALVLEAFVGPRPSGLVCDHRDANKQNNHASNLHWISYAENALRGGAHHKAKLDERDVVEIRNRHAQGGVTQTVLAAEFGVSGESVSLILSRKTWKHI